jgi:biopolymer transport protein ExbB
MSETLIQLRKGLGILATIGSTAPFIGLFGTVVGIIKAFADLGVGAAKGAGATAVMSGLSEALVATAVGIFVAIPAVVAFNAFGRRLRAVISRSEALAHALSSHLRKDDLRGAQPEAREARRAPLSSVTDVA